MLRMIIAMRLTFAQFSLNHSLSTIHRLLCPEDQLEHAHHEDDDEEMFKAKPPRVQLYCTYGIGNKKYPLFQQKDGDPLTPHDFEVINSIEDIIADIGLTVKVVAIYDWLQVQGDEMQDLLELDNENTCEDELGLDDWTSEYADDDVKDLRLLTGTVERLKVNARIYNAGLHGTIAPRGPRQAENSNGVQSGNESRQRIHGRSPTSSQRFKAKVQASQRKAQSRLTFQASAASPWCQADTKEEEQGTDQALKLSARRLVPPIIEKLNHDPRECANFKKAKISAFQGTDHTAPTESHAPAVKTTHEIFI
ncbi:hypothetical protein BDR22DRAFT_967931 [Usnea florida]